MMERIVRRFFNVVTREEKGMKPFLLKCGLALALICWISLLSHHTKRVKPFATSPGGTLQEETCINKVIGKNSPLGLSPRTRQSEEKDEFLLPEFSDLTKEADFGAIIACSSFKKEVETPRSKVGSPMAYANLDKDDYANLEGLRSEYATPSATSRTSFDFNRIMSLKKKVGEIQIAIPQEAPRISVQGEKFSRFKKPP